MCVCVCVWFNGGAAFPPFGLFFIQHPFHLLRLKRPKVGNQYFFLGETKNIQIKNRLEFYFYGLLLLNNFHIINVNLLFVCEFCMLYFSCSIKC